MVIFTVYVFGITKLLEHYYHIEIRLVVNTNMRC